MRVARRVLVAMMATATVLTAQVTVTGDASINSQYQWRGITTTNRPVVQPDFFVTVPAGRATVTAGAFASLEGGRYHDAARHISENGGEKAGLAEYDLWLESAIPVHRATFTVGATTYAYPNTAGTTSSSNTIEAYVKATFDAPFAPSLSVWQDVRAVQGAYAELSFCQGVGRFSVSALSGWNVGQTIGNGGVLGYFVRKGFTHADIATSTKFSIGAVTASPSLHVILAHDASTFAASPTRDARAKLWFGTSLSWSRTFGRTANNAGGGAAAAAPATGTR